MNKWVWNVALAATALWAGYAVPTAASRTQAATVPPAHETVQQNAGREATFVEQSFAATGAVPTHWLINDYTRVNRQYLSMSALEQFARNVATVLGLTTATATGRNVDNEHFYELSGLLPAARGSSGIGHPDSGAAAQRVQASVYCSSFGAPRGDDSTVLVVRLAADGGDTANLAQRMAALAAALHKVNVSSTLSVYIEGHVNGLRTPAQANVIVQNAFTAVHAARVQGLQTPLETSISGYSPEGVTRIEAGGQSMDIQVAVHPDSYRRWTNVLVGSPIIVDPY